MPRITRDFASPLEAGPGADGIPKGALVPAQEASTDSSHDSSGSAFYFTARSAFSEPSEEHAQQTILQVLDTGSGVVFDKVYQVMSGTIRVLSLYRGKVATGIQGHSEGWAIEAWCFRRTARACLPAWLSTSSPELS